MDYVLMNKDRELTMFKLEDNGNDVFSVSNVEVVCSNPYDNSMDLKAFLIDRKPPKNREYIDELLKAMQINSMTGYLNMSYALSLNDTFWVKPLNADVHWSDVNLYNNDFNETIAHFAFSGQGLAGLPMKSTSPEFGTNGMLPKCWKRFDSEIYLLKGGTIGCSNTGNEPYSEYYISQIEEAMQIEKFVPYDLIKFKGVLASKCKLFTSEDFGFKPFYEIYMPRTFYDIIKFYRKLGLSDAFNDMTILDAITLNNDRHLSNYGFLVDNSNGNVVNAAPIFDNGAGLLPYYTMDRDIMEYAFLQVHNSGLSFNQVANDCMTDRQRKMLKRLIGFKFQRHPLYNLPEERLERLEQLVQTRVQELLKL